MPFLFKLNFILAVLLYCVVSASSVVSSTTVVSGPMQCSSHSETNHFGAVRTVQYCSAIPYPTHNIGVVHNYNYPTYYYDHIHHYPICNTPGCSFYCSHSVYTCPHLRVRHSYETDGFTTIVARTVEECSVHSVGHSLVQYCSLFPHPANSVGVAHSYNPYPIYYYDHVHHYPICNTPGCSVYCSHSVYTCPYLNAVFPVVPDLIWAGIAQQYRRLCRRQYRMCAWNSPLFLQPSCDYQYYDCLGYYP